MDFKTYFKDWEYPFSVEPADDGWYCLYFPLLYADHDLISVYVKYDEKNKIFSITDSGDTLGIHCIPNKCNADILHKIIKSVGVQYKKEEIFTSATEDTFCIRIMEIVSAILAVDTTAHAL